jgi:dTDP-4-dehydrorhamnose reductase
MKRLFITGGSGLLGSKFRDILGEKYELITTHHLNPGKNSISFDLNDEKDVFKKITSLNPDLVIHAAALTDVDFCEDHHSEAWEVNAQGTGNIVNACEKTESKLIYVSTDFVFNGKKGMYTEEDETDTLGYYAYTKLKGEEFVQNSDLNYAIARVSVLYGWNRKMNFVTWVIDELRNGKIINIVTDQYNSPTLADNAAEAIIKMFEKDKRGIYHTAGSERVSRYDFALRIAQVFGLNQDLIQPIKSDDLIQKALRPRDSSLSVEKIQKDLDIKMLNTKEGLEKMKKEEDEKVIK